MDNKNPFHPFRDLNKRPSTGFEGAAPRTDEEAIDADAAKSLMLSVGDIETLGKGIASDAKALTKLLYDASDGKQVDIKRTKALLTKVENYTKTVEASVGLFRDHAAAFRKTL